MNEKNPIMNKKRLLPIILVSVLLVACNSSQKEGRSNMGDAGDSTVIAAGKLLFEKNCTSCHGFRQDGIGPQLGGILSRVSAEWLKNFIRDPAAMIASGDRHAVELHAQYKSMMPSFSTLRETDLQAITAYLKTRQREEPPVVLDSGYIKNPFPQPIPFSAIEIRLDSVVQIPASATEAPMARITKFTYQPGTQRQFVVDLRGKLYEIAKGKPVVYMDMAALTPHFVNRPGLGAGFGSFAFHPAFQQNGLLYTTHTEPARTGHADFALPDSIKSTVQWVLTEWKVADPRANKFAGTGREMLRIDMVSDIHGVQDIGFNPTVKRNEKDYGLLYIGVGDGGSVEHGYPWLPHSIQRPWGTVLRIDPQGNNSQNRQYGIPPDNPFVDSAGSSVLKEIYSYGFRNPHRFAWTKKRQLLVFNIGQHEVESIYLGKKGGDAGWPVREGYFQIRPKVGINTLYPLPANDSSYHFNYPIAAYDHDEGLAIAGGIAYRGSISWLQNKIIFGDIPSGRIFYIEADSIRPGHLAPIKEFALVVNGRRNTLVKACKNERVELRFGEDATGELYVLTKADGMIYKINAAKKDRNENNP